MAMSEKTCNQFIQEMRDAGFDFTFTAISGDVVIKGECKEGAIKSARQLTPDEQKSRIAGRLAK
jgi:hypothetical protein